MNLNKWPFGLLVFAVVLGLARPAIAQNQFQQVRSCQTPQNNPNLKEEITLQGYEAAILDFLSNGGLPADLERILLRRNLVQPHETGRNGPINPWFQNHGGVRTADFNGDGDLDVAVSLIDPGYDSGALFIYICNGHHFREILSPLTFAMEPDTGRAKVFDRAPKFIYVGDMTVSGRAEIVVDLDLTGASTLSTTVEILGWIDQTQDMRPLNTDQESYVADGSTVTVVNADNGFKAVVFRTGFSGSGIASGPQRQFTITYGWNGKQYVRTSEVGDPSNSRLHVAYDALTALNHGNFKTAMLLYNAVLKNSHLEDWDDNPELRQLLMAHAAYGLILADARQFGVWSDIAFNSYRNLQALAEQSGEAHFLWLKYGGIFWNVAKMKNDMHQACQAVNDAIQADINALPSNGPGGVRQLGLWPWFAYNVNWIPTDRGLSFCPL